MPDKDGVVYRRGAVEMSARIPAHSDYQDYIPPTTLAKWAMFVENIM